MQNAKDTFYEVLRDRIAAVNPERTIAVRGVLRPAVVVDENELAPATALPDCFRLRWGKMPVDELGAMPTVAMECEVYYETAGSAPTAGLDRGRALAAMDAELRAALATQPQRAMKKNYAAVADGGAAVTMATNIWWGEAVFGEVKAAGNKLARVATVTVMSYEEAGE